MKEIICEKINEKAYFEKLDNGLQVIIIPKKNLKKKYVIFGTRFGSIDNRFIMPGSHEEVFIPDGVAHFLEHKMFEQPDGTDSLYTLMGLGIDANAYTTNDHTAFLFECTDHFYEGLDELMDYVQHPYFTDENVEKEKGIIGQEIMMYDDDPGWQLYMNTMDCMYKDNPIKIDIAGNIESISKIDPDTLYKCYNTFYNPSNMIFVACGDFEPNQMLEEIKKRLVNKGSQEDIKRIYPTDSEEINKKYNEKEMPISMPIFMIAYKDKIITNEEDVIKRHIAIEVLLNILIGESSELYNSLYETGNLLGVPDLDYEFSNQYAHILISGMANDPKEVEYRIKEKMNDLKEKGIDDEELNRIKRKIYGIYVSEYNGVSSIARMFLNDFIKGVDSFEYINKFESITKKYVETILDEVFKEDKMVLSVVKGRSS